MSDNYKMPIVLAGNYSSKYEIEAVCKLFFHTARFRFSNDLNDAQGDNYIFASTVVDNAVAVTAEIRLNGDTPEKQIKTMSVTTKKDDIELELCRSIYHILCRKTGITPPWGLLTGIRPVKKVNELIQQGFSKDEIKKILTERFDLSAGKFNLAYETAINQLPILDKINRRAVSLYISIPFCPTRCSYCSFVSHSMDSAVKLMPEYISSLCRELEIIGDIVRNIGIDIDTVYFGGGTPTSISANDIEKIMRTVADNFNLGKIREYSFEAGRPDTITEEKLRVIKDYGAGRISVNPQTLNDDVLRVIGRKHSGNDALKAFELARKIGFNNINTDLIAGLPTESVESFRNTLDKIIELSPESITVHTLTVKRSADLFESGSANMTNPAAEMVDYSTEKLISCVYMPYYLYRQKNTVDNLENVGYAKKGFESWYNIFIMDETQTILGAGCAASTKLVYPDGKINRIHNYKFPYEYIRRFDELMQKKQEVSQCLKKIKSIPLK